MAKFYIVVESNAIQRVEIEAEDFEDALRKADRLRMADTDELQNLCDPLKWECGGGVEAVGVEGENGECEFFS